MSRILVLLLLLASFEICGQQFPAQKNTVENMRLANDYFMKTWPNPAEKIVLDKVRTSNLGHVAFIMKD